MGVIIIVLDTLGKIGAGVAAEAVAVDVGDAAVPQGGGGVVDLHQTALNAVVLLPSVSVADGDIHIGARLAHQQGTVGLPGGGAGFPLDGDDHISGLEPHIFGPAADKHAGEEDALVGVVDGGANAGDGILMFHAAEKIGIFLGSHIIGIGVADGGKQLLQCVGLIGRLGESVHIGLLQQGAGVLHRQSRSGGDQQRQHTAGSGQPPQEGLAFHSAFSFALL